jgi:hypothetical protein
VTFGCSGVAVGSARATKLCGCLIRFIEVSVGCVCRTMCDTMHGDTPGASFDAPASGSVMVI